MNLRRAIPFTNRFVCHRAPAKKACAGVRPIAKSSTRATAARFFVSPEVDPPFFPIAL
jgi:hypothetical protein